MLSTAVGWNSLLVALPFPHGSIRKATGSEVAMLLPATFALNVGGIEVLRSSKMQRLRECSPDGLGAYDV